MNESSYPYQEPADQLTECCTDMEHYVRRNPGTSLLLALGTGLIAAALIHALRPEPKPQRRLASLVADLEDRLREIGQPALRKAGSYATSGAHAVSDRVHHGEAQMEKFLKHAGRRLRGYWS